MRIFAFLLLLFLSTTHLEAQVSVYNCNTNSQQLLQPELDAGTNFFGSCFILGGNNSIHSDGSDFKTIWASKKITLKEGTRLGAYNNSGKVHLLLSDPSKLDIAVMNYQDLNSVKRYKKLEFGVPLPIGLKDSIYNFIKTQEPESSRLNPFVDWDIDVEAIFYHEASGWYETINGFYTREYEEIGEPGIVLEGNVTIVDDWLDVDSIPGNEIGNLYPFRIRYAPPKIGKWTCQISIKVKGNLAYRSDFFQFNVIESGDPGYVKVHSNHTNLVRGDRMIFPVGHNANTPDYSLQWGGGTNYPGVNHYSENSEKAANPLVWDEYLEGISDYLQKGGKYLRTIQAPWLSLIEFEERGNYFKRLHYASETDKLLDTLEKYDALVCFDLMWQTPMMKYGGYDVSNWDWGKYEWDGEQWHDSMAWNNNYDIPYCYNDKPFGEKEPYEMFNNPEDLKYHKQRIRYYIARYGYSTKIYEFEILSEPFHLNEMAKSQHSSRPMDRPFSENSSPLHTKVRNAVYNYHKVISEYMKDSLHVNQLVGIDMGSNTGDDRTFDYKSLTLSTIDVVGVNKYYSAPNALYISDNNYVYSNLVKTIWGNHGFIPVLIPEGGNAKHVCSNYSQFAVDAMTFPFCGIAGYNQWEGWKKDQGDLRDITIRAQNHMNGVDVINTLSEGGGNWHHDQNQAFLKFSTGWFRNDKPNLLEEQVYISSDKNYFVGYVKNRTYNVRTKGHNIISMNQTCLDTLTVGLDTLLCLDTNRTCTSVTFDPGNEPYIYQPQAILWNSPPNNQQFRINNLGNVTSYQIDWYHFGTGVYIKSDLVSSNGVIKLHYPPLIVTQGSNKSVIDNPVVWFVGHLINNYSKSLNEDEVINQNSESELSINTIHPNPFEHYFFVDSKEEDVFILQAIDGTLVGKYKLSKGETKISNSSLSKGIYIGTLQNQTQTFKIIKL